MNRDSIPAFVEGDVVSATALEQLRIGATQVSGLSNSFTDSGGTYSHPPSRRDRGVWFKPDTDVPAFGVMYVSDTDETQGELVITTKKPDGLALGEIIAINGPEDVDGGAYGKCRMAGDVPLRALVNELETVANGDVCGPKSGQWDLYKDFPGLIAFNVEDEDDLAWMRLDPDPTMDIELKDALPPSEPVVAGQQATAYRLDPDGTVDTDTEVEVFDELGEFRGKAYVSGEDRGSKGVVAWHREEDRVAIRTLQPHALRISGTAGAAVYYNTTQFTLSGTPVIMNPTGAIALEDYTAVNLAKNPLGLQFASNDDVHLEWNENAATPQWEAVDVGRPRPHRISGTAGSAVYYDTTQFTLSGSPVIMNPIGAISEENFEAVNLIKNPLGLIFGSGDIVHAEWHENAEPPQWEAVDRGTNQAKWLRFTASADFLSGGAITIDARTYHDGEDPEVAITSILNPDNLTGYDNATGIALIDTNVSPPTYTAVSISPVAQAVVTDWGVNDVSNKFEWKTRNISIMPRGDEADEAYQLIAQSVVTEWGVNEVNDKFEWKTRDVFITSRDVESDEAYQGTDCP